MKRKVVKLTESDLHRIIKNSVNRILKEQYGVAPDGRPINQQQAVNAANTPTNWETYQFLNDRQVNPYSRRYAQKAQDAASQQMGFYKRGENASEYVQPNLSRRTIDYKQDNAEQLPKTERFGTQRGIRGLYQSYTDQNQRGVEPSTYGFLSQNAQSFPSPSQEAITASNNALQRTKNYASGEWAKKYVF